MHLDRRELLQAAAAGTLTALADTPRDRIKAENERQGTTDWQLTYTRVAGPKMPHRCPWIEGYVGRASVRAGEKLDFFVSPEPASPFHIDLYRLGYYQGTGGRHVLRLGPFPGKTQPTPPVGEQRLRECQWEPCATL